MPIQLCTLQKAILLHDCQAEGSIQVKGRDTTYRKRLLIYLTNIMKHIERASIMRILADLIEADGIIDTRELTSLDKLRIKYAINQDDEKLSASYTFADSLQILAKADSNIKHNLLIDFESVAMSDIFCAREEKVLRQFG